MWRRSLHRSLWYLSLVSSATACNSICYDSDSKYCDIFIHEKRSSVVLEFLISKVSVNTGSVYFYHKSILWMTYVFHIFHSHHSAHSYVTFNATEYFKNISYKALSLAFVIICLGLFFISPSILVTKRKKHEDEIIIPDMISLRFPISRTSEEILRLLIDHVLRVP